MIPKNPIPIIIQTMAKILSFKVFPLISPNPTVVKVVNAKYIAYRYFMLMSASMIPCLTTQERGGNPEDIAIIYHKHPTTCVEKRRAIKIETNCFIPLLMLSASAKT
jgi:hypothetical protein